MISWIYRTLLSLLLLIILKLFMVSCNNKTDNQHSIVIEGNIKNGGNQSIVLQEISPNKVVEISSVTTDEHGNFKLSIKDGGESFYRLRMDENNTIHLYLNSGDTLQIEAEYPFLPRTYKVEGSPDSRLLQKMHRELIKSTDKLNELKDIYRESIDNPTIDLDSLSREMTIISNELYENDRSYLINFIYDNHTSPTIYVALYQYVLNNPILEIEKDFEIFKYTLESLKTHNPHLPHISVLESEISKHQMRIEQETRASNKLKPQDIAPDFSLKDTTDEKVTLSGLKGNYVLLYFWASWSKHSIEQAKIFTSIDIFNDENFKIIMISLDTDRKSWINAIKQEFPEHTKHISDLKMWESPVTRIYGISSIPVGFFIDPEGSIIAISTQTEPLIKEIQNHL